MEKASNYKPINNEANFGPPLDVEVVGGTHITFEFVAKRGSTFYMTRWPSGLPRHDDPPNALRFPHGLIIFGETVHQCASRIVRDQLSTDITSARVVDIDSYVDSYNHWHIEPCCIVELADEPVAPKGASEVVSFAADNLPDMTFWTKEDFMELVIEHLPELLS